MKLFSHPWAWGPPDSLKSRRTRVLSGNAIIRSCLWAGFGIWCFLAATFADAAAPDWAADAIWYQIFPERFRNGDPRNDPVPASLEGTWPYRVPPGWKVSPWTSDWYRLQPWEAADKEGFYHHAQLRRYGGDLQGILDRLDYLQRLGITAIYLNPVFDSPSLHKYGATHYHHIDRHFGPDPDGDVRLFASEDSAVPATWKWSSADRLFLKLIEEVHRRRMRIIIDGVFNHCGIPFWALQRARREGPTSPFADWFHIQRWDDPATPKDEFEYRGWSGVNDLPEFNRDEKNLHPGIREHFHAVVKRWMDPNGDGDPGDGVDGWRLDVAAEVPMGFWEEFRGWVKTIRPDAYITGEIWWEDYSQNKFRNARPWLDRAFDGVMNYRFGDAVFRLLNDPEGLKPGAFAREFEGIHRDYGYSASLALQNLFGSHDTARLGSAVVNPRPRQDHGSSVGEHRDYDVGAPDRNELARWKQMVAFQFLAPGAPLVYYGDEVGMWGADDPDCRKPMVWSDLRYEREQAHPFGKPRSSDTVRVNHELLGWYREWTALRKHWTVLRRGDFQIQLTDDDRRLLAFRREWGSEVCVAVFNASGVAAEVESEKLGLLPGSRAEGGMRRLPKILRIPAHGQVWMITVSPDKAGSTKAR